MQDFPQVEPAALQDLTSAPGFVTPALALQDLTPLVAGTAGAAT